MNKRLIGRIAKFVSNEISDMVFGKPEKIMILHIKKKNILTILLIATQNIQTIKIT